MVCLFPGTFPYSVCTHCITCHVPPPTSQTVFDFHFYISPYQHFMPTYVLTCDVFSAGVMSLSWIASQAWLSGACKLLSGSKAITKLIKINRFFISVEILSPVRDGRRRSILVCTIAGAFWKMRRCCCINNTEQMLLGLVDLLSVYLVAFSIFTKRYCSFFVQYLLQLWSQTLCPPYTNVIMLPKKEAKTQ